jgi:Uncharacterized protein conserved in bacteria (DUF2330)
MTMKKIALFLLLTVLPVLADPCGMVPPISLDGGDAQIDRVGEQLTYAFYKDGFETIVIHPGFTGNVDNFGMLIPFPTVPALRKVPDSTFEQLTQALDPPTITYYLHQYYEMDGRANVAKGMVYESAPASAEEVVVLKEEAVGMYEIAVLAAGSAEALKRWMTDHGYQFPDGMEDTCNDYVKDKWCFVAVKTRVGSKAGVDPRPGMRSTEPARPKDSVFSGKVQAMGFRFHTQKLVVPMRLSAFNGGDLHNTVYLLAEEPMRASNLPVEFVKRQLTGDKLYSNLTDLLPYKIEGGTEDDMSPNDWKSLEGQRNPVPHNGVAAELFATDLLASDLGQLTHDFEEREKALLDIGERLNLRGGNLDALHNTELATDREEIKSQALSMLKGMTLTVIEGDFPRDVIANENIKFEPYKLKTIEGLTGVPGDPDPVAEDPKPTTDPTALPAAASADAPPTNPQGGNETLMIAALVLLGGVAFFALRRKNGGAAVLALFLLFTPQVKAQDSIKTVQDLINQLDQPDRRKEAYAQLESKRQAALPYLIARYKNEQSPPTERGYCLTLMIKTPDKSVVDAVWETSEKTQSPLVRLWSQAALVGFAESPEQLLALVDPEMAKASADPDYPRQAIPVSAELQRPIALKLKEWGQRLTLEDQLMFLGVGQRAGQAANVSPTIASVISPALREAKVDELVRLMFQSKSQEVRRLSAALLAGFQEEKRKAIFASVMEELQVNSQSQQVPWAGGALFLPQFSNMNKSEAQELITGLTRWSVWTDIHKTPEAQVTPLENNLRSYNLWTAAGGGSLNWRQAKGGKEWLQAYGKLLGAEAVADLLREQKVPKDSAFWAVVKLLK